MKRNIWQFPVCYRCIKTLQMGVAPCARQLSPTWLRQVHLGSDLVPHVPALAPTWLRLARPERQSKMIPKNTIPYIGTEILSLQ